MVIFDLELIVVEVGNVGLVKSVLSCLFFWLVVCVDECLERV